MRRALHEWLFVLLAAAGLVVAAQACGGKEPKRPEAPRPIIVTTIDANCLSAAPPAAPPQETLAGPEAGCPEQFVGCVTPELAVYLLDLQDYARKAWTECGPPPPPAKETP